MNELPVNELSEYELPVDLAPPLHLMEPGGVSSWTIVAYMLLALALLYWWRRRRRDSAPDPTATPPAPFSAPRAVGLATAIDALYEKYRDHHDLRRGCHALARLLREHFAGTRTLTAREIAVTLRDRGVVNVFELLAELQFSREEPRPSDFSGICEIAREAVETKAPAHEAAGQGAVE